MKRRMTPSAAEKMANSYIARGTALAYDVAAAHGQIFDNVCHMVWFRDLLAAQILEDHNGGHAAEED